MNGTKEIEVTDLLEALRSVSALRRAIAAEMQLAEWYSSYKVIGVSVFNRALAYLREAHEYNETTVRHVENAISQLFDVPKAPDPKRKEWVVVSVRDSGPNDKMTREAVWMSAKNHLGDAEHGHKVFLLHSESKLVRSFLVVRNNPPEEVPEECEKEVKREH